MSAIAVYALLGLLLLAAIVLLLRRKKTGGCCGTHEKAPAAVRAADRNPAHYPHRITMHIGGMTCSNCARRVENALCGLPGVWAKVSIDNHTADIRYKDGVTPQALREAVIHSGYAVLSEQ